MRSQHFHPVVQPDFPHVEQDTLQKLDAIIRPCDLIVHIVGRKPGSIVPAAAVAGYLAHADAAGSPDHLARLFSPTDFRALTYFQWEPWLGFDRGISVLVYATEGHEASDHPLRSHLDALRQRGARAETLQDNERRCGQILADLIFRFGSVPRQSAQLVESSRLISSHTTAQFLGREKELARLDAVWNDKSNGGGTNLLTIVAWGGVGKTALLGKWVDERFTQRQWKLVDGRPESVRYFDWTFYDQGTRSDGPGGVRGAGVGAFWEMALSFFSDANPGLPGKGKRLARLIQEQPTLLVLDGIEPLQYPLNHPQAGRLTDPDLRDLLTTLAQHNPGLCIVSSRQRLSDLSGMEQLTALRLDLDDLDEDDAIALLSKLGVDGSDEALRAAVRDYGCHALSLTLLGRYLSAAKGGDIRRRDTIKLERASEQRDVQTRNAWRVLEAYEHWMSGPGARPEVLQALRLTGLFDRPAAPDCLAELRAAPAIPGMTDLIVPLEDDAWNIVLDRLRDAHLIQLKHRVLTAGDRTPRLEAREVALDAHPLIREYFSRRLREQHGDGFTAAHTRLFEYLCRSTGYQPDTLEALQPLYQAIPHGCLAGRHQEALDAVYIGRILRGQDVNGFYSQNKLGAIGENLGVVSSFFDRPWDQPSRCLSDEAQAWILNEAGFLLRALGRLAEAIAPMKKTLELRKIQKNWEEAAISACNLSEFLVASGRLDEASAAASKAVEFADLSDLAFWKLVASTTIADVSHKLGNRSLARVYFDSANTQMKTLQSLAAALRYSIPTFRCCNFILASVERAVWLVVLGGLPASRLPAHVATDERYELHDALDDAMRRTSESLIVAERSGRLLDIALDHLTFARVELYRAVLSGQVRSVSAQEHLNSALERFRAAGRADYLPVPLLVGALYYGTLGQSLDVAAQFLDEAQELAERGSMPLYLADIHFHRARLFGSQGELARARQLIETHHYRLRQAEFDDASAAAVDWAGNA